MAHWKSFKDTRYLGEWDFEEERIVTIHNVEQGEIDRGVDPKTKQPLPVERQPFMYLLEYERPLILNVTNAKVISAMYASTMRLSDTS